MNKKSLFTAPIEKELKVIEAFGKSGKNRLYAQGRLLLSEIKIFDDAVYAILDYWESQSQVVEIPYWFTSLCVSLEHFGAVTTYSTVTEKTPYGKITRPVTKYIPSKFCNYLGEYLFMYS